MSNQETTTKKVAELTETISTNLTSLLTELIRASPPQAPPPPISNMNKKILGKLESLTLEIGTIRSDLHAIKAHTEYEREAEQKKLIDRTHLVDLLDLGDKKDLVDIDEPKVEPVEKNNELARRYNSELLHPHDFIAQLCNPRGNYVFGFPTTVGALINLDQTSERLLCGAFGLKYVPGSDVFVKFCGFDPDVVYDLDSNEISGGYLAATRVKNRHKRATDIAAAGNATASTRKAAALYNAQARRHNERADDEDYEIKPIHDGRGLVVPGFPTEYGWFSTPHRRDVLFLLREYGLNTAPGGCLQRFEEFVGVPTSVDTEQGVEWFL